MQTDNLPNVITITRSDSKGKRNIWWWIAGKTKPVKDILSNNGAHWSRRRQAWYYIGPSLPAAIQALETPRSGQATSTTAVPSGVQQAQVILDQLFETAVAGDPVEQAQAQQQTKHLIAKLHILRDREFPGSKNYHWQITGTPSEAESTVLAQHCHRNETWKVWTYFHEDLPEAVQHIVIIEEAENNTLRQADPAASEINLPPMPEIVADDAKSEEPETVRIIKPQSHPAVGTEPDAIQVAITQAKSAALPALLTTHSSVTSSKRCTPIGQQYIGELTGNISGNVLCFGYAIHEGITVYVNLGGPRMAVEAIRAKLGKGEVVNLTPWDGPAIELTAGEGNTGKYKDFFAHLPEAKFTSLILVHEMLVAPSYGGKSTTFIIRTSDEQAIAQLKQHVTELVNIPIFDTWAGYLWQAGQAAMLVRRTHSGGEIDMWTITLDIDAWTRLITGGLDQDVITLPR